MSVSCDGVLVVVADGRSDRYDRVIELDGDRAVMVDPVGRQRYELAATDVCDRVTEDLWAFISSKAATGREFLIAWSTPPNLELVLAAAQDGTNWRVSSSAAQVASGELLGRKALRTRIHRVLNARVGSGHHCVLGGASDAPGQ